MRSTPQWAAPNSSLSCASREIVSRRRCSGHRRIASTRLNHPRIRFQLAKFRVKSLTLRSVERLCVLHLAARSRSPSATALRRPLAAAGALAMQWYDPAWPYERSRGRTLKATTPVAAVIEHSAPTPVRRGFGVACARSHVTRPTPRQEPLHRRMKTCKARAFVQRPRTSAYQYRSSEPADRRAADKRSC